MSHSALSDAPALRLRRARRRRPSAASAAVALLLLAAGAPEPLRAQVAEELPSIRGWVVEQLWASGVPGVEVVLMDDELREVGRTTADEGGRFSFPLPAPGSYLVQARYLRAASSLGQVEVVAGTRPQDLVLEIASSGTEAVLDCFAREGASGTGVVMGIAHEIATETALPGARVVVNWVGPGGSGGGEAETLADEDGRFYVCGVPAGAEFTLRTQFLGKMSNPLGSFVLEGAAIVRADVPLDLGTSELGGRITASVMGADAEVGVITGMLVDATTGQPVTGATVRIEGSPGGHQTDPRGRFRIDELPEGTHVLEIEHLAYGTQRAPVELPAESGVRVDLRVTPRALVVSGIEVTARRRSLDGDLVTAEARRPVSARTLAGADMALLEQQGVTTLNAVQRVAGAGVIVREGNRPGQACIQASRGAAGMGGDGSACNMVVVILDGTEAFDAAGTLADLRVEDIESMEYLTPLEAGFRYGLRASARGALVIWTRGRGPYRSPGRRGGD